jgi:pyruvate formate lyase activating enzyme
MYVKETNYWHRLSDSRIQCDVCPRECKLREGQRGLCFVRQREGDKVVLTSYGKSSGFCLDPIEKKPLNHFLPGSSVLSFGTAGCNLACKFCQNWDMSKSREMDTLSNKAMPEELAQACKKYGAQSIAFTYNDPVIFLEYAIDTAIACHELGIKSVAVTAGYISPKPREEFFSVIDAANIDLKAFSERFYKKLTGSNLKDVLDTILYVHHETNVWMELTTLLIPGENDSKGEIETMCRWLRDNVGKDVPLHFTAFHPDWKMKDKAPTPVETLHQAREIAINLGLKYVYTGNVHDLDGASTYCPSCKQPVIGRDWHQIHFYGLDEKGQCKNCHYEISGFFNQSNGHWGRKRLPVFIR